MTTMFDLHGKVALVTGSSQGLGFEIARGLAVCGATVLVNGRNAGRIQEAAQALVDEGLSALPMPFDVADRAVADAATRDIMNRHQRLDILVNNVGQRMRRSIDKIGGNEMRSILDIDLIAAFELAKQAAEAMRRGGYGRIIMISSIQGLLGRAGDIAYITAKGGMIALTRALAAEYGPDGITCNCIAPGSFITPSNAALELPEAQALAHRRTFLGRFGRPEEIAGAAVFLASGSASYVTGAVLTVDGGWSAAM